MTYHTPPCMYYVRQVDRLGVLMLNGKAPFVVPDDEASGIPRAYGRSYAEITVQMLTTVYAMLRAECTLQAAKGKRVTTMRATLDGVNAPLTVGNFKDLATRGFYNGVPVTFIDESTVMTGLPKGKAVRFQTVTADILQYMLHAYNCGSDARAVLHGASVLLIAVLMACNTSLADVLGFEVNGAVRRVPMEVRAEGDKDIQYGESLEEQGRFKAKPLFALKFDPLYTPAGLNTLDGNYAVFGYILEGADALDDLVEGDQIVSVKIVDSIELKP
eukprot:6695-Heterococcus_DN1.PRE.3